MIGIFILATAAFIDGNKLLAYCQGAELDRRICEGFVAGSADALSDLTNALPEPKGTYCRPMNMTIQQATDIVVKALIEHPERRSDSAADVTIGAIIKAFPCP